jgi:hypothetical protein
MQLIRACMARISDAGFFGRSNGAYESDVLESNISNLINPLPVHPPNGDSGQQ